MHWRPLTEEQVTTFVHNWYGIVEKSLTKDPVQAEGIAAEKPTASCKDCANRIFGHGEFSS